MNELLARVTEKTGLSPEQAQAAIHAVVGFLKERLPAPAAGALDSIVAGGQSGNTSGLPAEAANALSGIFGKQ